MHKADANQRLSVKQKIVGKRPPRKDSAFIHRVPDLRKDASPAIRKIESGSDGI